MAALISLLTVISLSLLITRIATVALALTGLSRESAKFQARSAFTGVGFTTNEAEQVVSHPVRRRILMLLMLLGNVGVITTISSLILTFLNTASNQQWLVRSLILGIGLAVLWVLATSKWIDRYLSRLINWALHRWTTLNVQDYANLLRLSGDYTVMEMEVQPDDWLADRALGELGLRQEGVVVLGIQRENGRYVGAPKGHTRICAGDVLILYGRLPLLNELDQRGADWTGEQSHQKAVAQQQRNLAKQDRQEAEDNL
ncbi:MAG: TrkA C-terminal domain-containing protein [Coleofasciculus sp. B1-GNL1-01]|uniref:TrkA C-terminal domain-containing protein n=1 Tax=Coleofasciculus sp. B1-GNL1-01 TaxID=3068484 RepID=UPI0032FAB78B